MKRPFFENDLDWQPVGGSDDLLTASMGEVAILRLHRPSVRNALSNALFSTLVDEIDRLDAAETVAAIVLTGGRRVFAAGADVREFAGKSPEQIHELPRLDEWHRLRRVRKPLIAAVNGAALGGGCELVLLCDIAIAGEKSFFGQPEIDLGLIPGGGGTQRLIRAVGKSLAMEMILTGRILPAREALRHGLVSQVQSDELVLDRAMCLGEAIAAKPRESVARAKQAVLLAESEPLPSGVDQERRHFEALFASTETQKRMSAFLERRSQPRGRS